MFRQSNFKHESRPVWINKLPTLKPKYNIEIAEKQNVQLADEMLLLSDFYDTVKRFPKFKQSKAQFQRPYQVFNWLINETNKFIKNGDWQLIQVSSEEESKTNFYQIINTFEFDVDDTLLYVLPIGWIEKFNTAYDSQFYNLLLQYFGTFIIQNQISYFNQCDYFAEAVMFRLDYDVNQYNNDSEELEFLQQLQVEYDSYNTGQYKVLLEKLLAHATTNFRRLLYNLTEYKPASSIEKNLIDLMKDGLELIQSKFTLHDFCGVTPDYYSEDCPAVMPDSYVYTFWDSDLMASEYIQFLTDWVNQGSTIYPFMLWQIFDRETKKFRNLPITDYPYKLTSFLINLYQLVSEDKCSQSLNRFY